MDSLRKCLVGGTPEVRANWNRICDDMESTEARWIAELRARGYKAAHPNDGWVNRLKNVLSFVYPQFNDGAQVGDLVMLGWSFDPPHKNRSVRLIKMLPRGIIPSESGGIFLFEDAP